jgi:hypothetical protein
MSGPLTLTLTLSRVTPLGEEDNGEITSGTGFGGMKSSAL